MNRLPVEILRQICLDLAAPAYCPPKDLSSFSQVNRLCNQTAIPILYRNLTLKFNNMDSLEATISAMTEAPRGIHFKKYARRLSLICMEFSEDHESKQIEGWRLEPWAISMTTEPGPATRKGFLEHDLTSGLAQNGGLIISESNISALSERKNWAPVVSLIANLGRLERFDFITSDDFATTLMEAFSQHHPGCRIDILHSQTVGYIPPDPQVWEEVLARPEFNMDTLQLPGLHTLVTSSPVHRKSGRLGGRQYLVEHFPFLFAGSGLKHLCIASPHAVDLSTMDLLKAMWESLIDTKKPRPISPLESITFLPGGNKDLLFDLAAAGDFSHLHTLDLGLAGPHNLVGIAELFSNLERLFIDLSIRSGPTPPTGTDFEESILGILEFRPLKYLYIRGLRSAESLDRIIQHHGPSLKGLAIRAAIGQLAQYPKLGQSELHEMAIYCPNLEELRLQIPRSGGNQAECEMYRALSKFRNLRTLFLDLFFDARPAPPKWDMIKVTTEKETLRRTFINAAMDESLAVQIWTMIRNNTSRLKNLRLLPVGSIRFPPDETYLHKCFARSYLLTHYNPGNPGFPAIEQIGKRAWEVRHERKDLAIDIRRDGELVLSDGVLSVLHELWPELPKQTDWWTGWTSFPLQPGQDLIDGA